MHAPTNEERSDEALLQRARRLIDAALQLGTPQATAVDTPVAQRRKAISLLTDLNEVLADLRKRHSEIGALTHEVARRTIVISAYLRMGELMARSGRSGR